MHTHTLSDKSNLFAVFELLYIGSNFERKIKKTVMTSVLKKNISESLNYIGKPLFAYSAIQIAKEFSENS